MNNNIQVIKFLTKLKLSLGIDTKSEEIQKQVDDLKTINHHIEEKKEKVSIDLSKVDLIINDIDMMYNLAEEDLLKGNAEVLSTKLMSFQLTIKRAEKQHIEISKILEMEKEYKELLVKYTKEYINNIINGIEYRNGEYKRIIILYNNIIFNLKRLNININIICYEELEKLKTFLIKKKFSLNKTRLDYQKNNDKLRHDIFVIESSQEKKMADLALEQVKNKRKR